MSTAVTPKFTKDTLEPTPNTLAFLEDGQYKYYALRLGDKIGPYVKIEKLPGVIREGYVTYKRKLYRLTYRDFFRRRLNVEHSSYGTSINNVAGAAAGTTPPDTTIGMVKGNSNSEQPRVIETPEVQLSKSIDVAWDEQIKSLLYSIDPEEEWDLSSIA